MSKTALTFTVKTCDYQLDLSNFADLDLLYIKSEDGTDRFKRYLEGWEDFYQVRLYEIDDKAKTKPLVITKKSVDKIREKYGLSEKDVKFFIHQHMHRGKDLTEIEVRFPYGTTKVNGRRFAPDEVLNWNHFQTEICVGEGHKDSCDSQSGNVLVVNYTNVGLVIFAIIIGIVLLVVIWIFHRRNQGNRKKLKSIKEAVNHDNTRKMGGRPQQKFDEFLYNLERESDQGKKLAEDLKRRYVDISCIHPTWDFENLRRLGGGAFGDAYLAEIEMSGSTRTAVIKVLVLFSQISICLQLNLSEPR